MEVGVNTGHAAAAALPGPGDGTAPPGWRTM